MISDVKKIIGTNINNFFKHRRQIQLVPVYKVKQRLQNVLNNK